MTNYINNSNLAGYLFIVTISLLLGACASDTMSLVNKSLEDGDFVPTEALSTTDFLNEYTHHIPEPKHQLIDIDIAFERNNVLATGDNIYAQIALATKAPELDASNFHILVYNSMVTSEPDLKEMRNAVQSIQDNFTSTPKGSTLSIDWYNQIGDSSNPPSSLVKSSEDIDLVAFLRQYARLPLIGRNHHFVLILGPNADLDRQQKQNSVDIANIFHVKNSTLSVLAIGEQPEIAFLKKLGENGNGLFSVATNKFNYKEWLLNEVQYMNATKFENIKVTITAKNSISIREIKSPVGLLSNSSRISHTVSKLTQGDQFVMIIGLDLLLRTDALNQNLINVDVEYYDKTNNRYRIIHKSAKLNFVDDRNDILVGQDQNVARSLLILRTQEILRDIPPIIREKRYYQAIALLTEHKIKLEKLAATMDDRELVRDANVLGKYTNKLYDFDETIFQTLKIWDDFDLDTNRYTESFK